MDEDLAEGLRDESSPQQGSATDYDYYSAPISLGDEGGGIREGKFNKKADVFSKSSDDTFHSFNDLDDYDVARMGEADIRISKFNDYRKDLADQQHWLGDLKRAALQTAGGFVTGIIENVGLLATLPFNSDGDYSNGLIEFAQDARKK